MQQRQRSMKVVVVSCGKLQQEQPPQIQERFSTLQIAYRVPPRRLKMPNARAFETGPEVLRPS